MYGKVINGGAPMRKGVSKGINDKLDGFAAENRRRAAVAGAVANVYKVRTLSEQHVNDVKGGSFKKGTVPSKV